jgi:hypothetical protein
MPRSPPPSLGTLQLAQQLVFGEVILQDTPLFHVGGLIGRILPPLFGNVGLAAAAYNAGPRRVHDWMTKRGGLPAETRHYVRRITGRPVEPWAQRDVDTEVELRPLRRGYRRIKSALRPPFRECAPFSSGIASPSAERSLPQPSQFAIGRSVPLSILASERAAIARWKLKDRAERTREAVLH